MQGKHLIVDCSGQQPDKLEDIEFTPQPIPEMPKGVDLNKVSKALKELGKDLDTM